MSHADAFLGWACRQPWSNRRLGIHGFSASAIVAYNSMHLPMPYEPLLSVGPAAADVRVSSTAPSTDPYVVVADVRPDGKAFPVGTGALRTAYPHVDRAKSLLDRRGASSTRTTRSRTETSRAWDTDGVVRSAVAVWDVSEHAATATRTAIVPT